MLHRRYDSYPVASQLSPFHQKAYPAYWSKYKFTEHRKIYSRRDDYSGSFAYVIEYTIPWPIFYLCCNDELEQNSTLLLQQYSGLSTSLKCKEIQRTFNFVQMQIHWFSWRNLVAEILWLLLLLNSLGCSYLLHHHFLFSGVTAIPTINPVLFSFVWYRQLDRNSEQ